MKKFIILLFALLMILMTFYKSNRNETVKIPDSAIRFRILANSNSPRDQKIKQDIKDKMQEELYNLLKSTENINEARTLIKNNIDSFDNILNNEMKDIEYSYTIDYGMHEFPEKTYKGITYDAGYYESLLVTLGEGKGDNWWCVLFPPLCILEAEDEDEANDVQYKSFIKELIKKYF